METIKRNASIKDFRDIFVTVWEQNKKELKETFGDFFGQGKSENSPETPKTQSK